jgi:tRNA pseudouridine32 synthase/23S rRNA pseudouridine746 synthase
MERLDYRPPETPLAVIHADHEILLVDKPAGLLSVPGKGDHLADCLLDPGAGGLPRALLVHRLDMDTSGVMVFALTPQPSAISACSSNAAT